MGWDRAEGSEERAESEYVTRHGRWNYEMDFTLGRNSVQLEFLMVLRSRCVCVSNGVRAIGETIVKAH